MDYNGHSKKSENLGQFSRQIMLWLYLKIWEWDMIFGRAAGLRAVKVISSPGVRSPCVEPASVGSTL